MSIADTAKEFFKQVTSEKKLLKFYEEQDRYKLNGMNILKKFSANESIPDLSFFIGKRRRYYPVNSFVLNEDGNKYIFCSQWTPKNIVLLKNIANSLNVKYNFGKVDNAEVILTPFRELVSAWVKYIESADALKLLLQYGTNNIIGDFAEKLCIEYFKGEKLPNSNASSDFKVGEKQYQVKARKLNEKNVPTTQLSAIRSKEFDYLIVILFSNIGELYEVRQYEKEKISGKYSKLQNGEIITTTNDFIGEGEPLTDKFSKKFNIPIHNKHSYKNRINNKKDKINKANNDDLLIDTNTKTKQEGIAAYVRRHVKELIANSLINDSLLSDLLDLNYSKRNFGISYPFFKDNKDGGKCNTTPFKIKGKDYFITSEWVEKNGHREKFNNWLKNTF